MGFLDKLKDKKEGPLWNYKTDSTVFQLSFSPDNSMLLAGCASGQLCALNAAGRCLWTIKLGDQIGAPISFSSDGSVFAVGSCDNAVYLISCLGEIQWRHETGDSVFGVSISGDGSLVAAGSEDGKLYLINRSGRLVTSREMGVSVRGISMSLDGSIIGAGIETKTSQIGKVCLLSNSGDVLWAHDLMQRQPLDTCVTSDGMLLATHSHGHVYLFSRQGQVLWSKNIGVSSTAISCSLDGKLIAVGASVAPGDGRIFLFTPSGETIWNYKIGTGTTRQISISSNNNFIAAVTHNHSGKVHLLDHSGRLLLSYLAKDALVSTSFAPNNSWLAVGGADDRVYFFDLGKLL